MIVSETQFILGGGTDASLDQALIPPIPATPQTAVLAAGGPAPAWPSAPSQPQAQAMVQTSTTQTAFGPNLDTFNLAPSMARLNAMRIAFRFAFTAEREKCEHRHTKPAGTQPIQKLLFC